MSFARKLLIVGLGGAMGAIARYCTTWLALRWFGPQFPWGTLVANLLGCFVMGLLFALSRDHIAFSGESAKLLWMVGFLGAYTTFSSYALDSVYLLRQHSLSMMFLNVGLQNLLGIFLVIVGMRVAEWLS